MIRIFLWDRAVDFTDMFPATKDRPTVHETWAAEQAARQSQCTGCDRATRTVKAGCPVHDLETMKR